MSNNSSHLQLITMMNSQFTYRGVDSRTNVKDAHYGDIIIENDTFFVFKGDKWEPLYMAPSDHYISSKPIVMVPKICSRCGAPLKTHKCDYCGTLYDS